MVMPCSRSLKAVEQESEIRKAEIVLLAAGIALKACRLVFLTPPCVPKQPADQASIWPSSTLPQ